MNQRKARQIRKYAQRKVQREFMANLQLLLLHIRKQPLRQRLRFAWMVTFGRPRVSRSTPRKKA